MLVHAQLVNEGYRVGSTTVRAYMGEQRRQRQEVYVFLIWRLGEAAQVEFFKVTVEVSGERQKAWLFVLDLMHSERDFVWLYGCTSAATRSRFWTSQCAHLRASRRRGGVLHLRHLKAAVAAHRDDGLDLMLLPQHVSS